MTKKPKTIIHVNRQFIAFNAKAGEPVLPTYIIRRGSKATYGHAFETKGLLVGIDPRKKRQLKCGARAWLETDGPVKITGAMTYQDAIKIKEKYLRKHEQLRKS
jgi:hypothetical protein